MNDIISVFYMNVTKKIFKKINETKQRPLYNDFLYRSLDITGGIFNVSPELVKFRDDMQVKLIDSFIDSFNVELNSFVDEGDLYTGEYKQAVADFVKILEEERKKLDENIGRTATED